MIRRTLGFKCSCCGLCCKAWSEEVDRGDGFCRYLDETNHCSIYDSRPDHCRVDKTWKDNYEGVITKLDYYKMTYEICKNLQNNDNI